MSNITGKSLAVTFSGTILLWSGIKGKSWSAVLRDLVSGKNPQLSPTANPLGSSGGSGVMPGRVAATGGSPGTVARAKNKAIMRMLAASYGWVGQQWTALDNLEMSEARYNNLAQNPTSSAYGMGQFLDSTWASYGPKTSDPTMQISYMLRYIKDRYGNPVNAWNFHLAHNWY